MLVGGEEISTMYKKILVPLDGSGLAEMALPHAVEIARGTGSEVLLLRVVVSPLRDIPPADTTADAHVTAWRSAQEETEKYLAGVRSELRQEQIEVRALMV